MENAKYVRLTDSELYLPAVEQTTLSQQVAVGLRNEIIENRLPAGTKITESELSNALNVSRTVVREAIAALVQEGLLVKATNRYTKVTECTRRDIEEIFDLRGALEVTAARACLRREDIVTKLVEKDQAMALLNSQPQVSQLAVVYADIGFHTLIIEASGNSRLLDAWNKILSPLLRLIYRYVLSCTSESPLGNVTYDHQAIIRAFDTRDFDTVSKALIGHITLMRDILLREQDALDKANINPEIR